MKTPVFTSAAARSSVFFTAARCTYARISSPFSARVASCSTSSCSGASTKKVAPNSVSGRVVNTGTSSSSSSTLKTISAPSERPIQLRWRDLIDSGQSTRLEVVEQLPARSR